MNPAGFRRRSPGKPGFFVSGSPKGAVAQKLERGRAARWTREKIDTLNTIEVRQLQANAVRLGETEIAALCDEVLGSRPRGRVAARV